MKAIVYEKYGSPDILELRELKRPEPNANEVLVKIRAASVNKADWFLLNGKPFPVRLMAGFFKPKNQILGADIAGMVERVGAEVTLLKPGDKVFGDLSAGGFGGFAEYVAADEKLLSKKPSNLGFEEAAALPMASVTALQGLRDHGKIKEGQEVLINGASGGVGSYAVQIAKAFGAKVTAVCSAGKIEHAKKLGADTIIDYTKTDFTKENKQYDLIFDIAANHSLKALRRVLKLGGTYVTAAFSPAAMLYGPWKSLTAKKTIKGYLAKPNRADLQFICKWAEEEKIVPVIEKTFTLDDTPEALRMMGKGRAAGKLVVAV